jgi:hypothetical protein
MHLRGLLEPITTSDRVNWRKLALLYTVSQVFHIASWNSMYWDMWFMYRDKEQISELDKTLPIRRIKLPFTYLWEEPMMEVGVWVLRMVVIVSFFIGAILLYRILKLIPNVSPRVQSVTVVLFLLLPINGARIGLSSARASLALMLFLAAGLLICKRRTSHLLIGLAIISYVMFWDSFQVFSLVLLIPLVLVDVTANKRISSYTLFVGFAIVLLAIVNRYLLSGLVVHLGFAGADDGYNSIKTQFLVRAALVGGLLSMPLIVGLARGILRQEPRSRSTVGVLEIALFALALGTFPYLAAGHFANLSDWISGWLPDNSDWDSRHQLLQGFGFALLGAAFLETVRPRHSSRYLFVLVMACLVLNTSTYASYYVDGLKQRDFMAELKSRVDELSDVTIFQVVDEARDVNARGRGVRDYEWEGMLTQVLGRPVEIFQPSPIEPGCTTEVLGKSLKITKISGRMRAILTRSQIVAVELSDLVSCRDAR